MDPGTVGFGGRTGSSPEELARLFRQVRIARRRETFVFQAFRRRYGVEAAEATGLHEKDFEAWEKEESLEALLGCEDVPSWLREILDRQVRSEAILVSHLLFRFGEKGRSLARRAFREFGVSCGREARARHPEGRPDDLAAALEEDHLHGLPNQAPAFLERRPDGFVLRRAHCPCQRAWTILGAPSRSLCDLDRCWQDGFCDGFGAGIRHLAGSSVLEGATECRDEFLRKAPMKTGPRPGPSAGESAPR